MHPLLKQMQQIHILFIEKSLMLIQTLQLSGPLVLLLLTQMEMVLMKFMLVVGVIWL